MSVVRDLILKADDDLRYPSSGELQSMVDYLSQGSSRLSVVRSLTANEKKSSLSLQSSCSAGNPNMSPLEAMRLVRNNVLSVFAITAGTCA